MERKEQYRRWVEGVLILSYLYLGSPDYYRDEPNPEYEP